MGASTSTADSTTDGSTPKTTLSWGEQEREYTRRLDAAIEMIKWEHARLVKGIKGIYVSGNVRGGVLLPPSDQKVEGLVHMPFACDGGNPNREAKFATPKDAQNAVAAAIREALKDFKAFGSNEHAVVELSSQWWLVFQAEDPVQFMSDLEPDYGPPESLVDYDFPLTIYLVDAHTAKVSSDHGVIGPFGLDDGFRPAIRKWIYGVVEKLSNCENIDESWRRCPWPEHIWFDGEIQEPDFKGDRSWHYGIHPWYWEQYKTNSEDGTDPCYIILPNPRVPECAPTAVSCK
jgi:hypothetical protein